MKQVGTGQSRSNFLHIAMAEAARYGDDPMVLFRELGQNSRDAKASKIEITTFVENGYLRIEFSDDGKGMSFDHAKRYLFRLYASSKDKDDTNAGRFGVGFWSVLLVRPAHIQVHSMTSKSKWAVGLTGDLATWKSLSCSRDSCGTTVSLWLHIDRGRQFLLDQIERAIDHYLAHLQTASRKPYPLAVFFNGRNINKPFSLDAPGTLQFHDGSVQGVVGLGTRPSYILYARGLPVLEGFYLQELQGSKRNKRHRAEPDGLAPVYVINGNKLSVVLNRNTVIYNNNLEKVVKVAQRRFDELVAYTIDGYGTRLDRIKRILLSWTKKVFNIPKPYRLIMIGLVLFVFSILLVSILSTILPVTKNHHTMNLFKANEMAKHAQARVAANTDQAVHTVSAKIAPQPIRPLAAVDRENTWENVHTSTVNRAHATNSWAFSYSSDKPMMFRRIILDSWDSRLGWQISTEPSSWRNDICHQQNSGSIEIRIPISGQRGKLFLPVPTGYTPVCDSAIFNGYDTPMLLSPSGALMVSLNDHSDGTISYLVTSTEKIPTSLIQKISKPPLTTLPPALESLLKGYQHLDTFQRINLAIDTVDTLIAYDRSPHTVTEYKSRINGRNDWLDQVLAIGAGDCDVINGVLVLILRRLGIASRLVAGIVGQDHKALNGWHAWVEVATNGKLIVQDATPGARFLASNEPQGRTAPKDCPDESIQTQSKRPTITSTSFSFHFSPQQLLFIMSLAGLLLSGIIYKFAPKHHSKLKLIHGELERQKILVDMLSDAIKRPEAWKGVQGIWHRKILPCIDGKKISLAKLVHIAHKGQAFVGDRNNDLVKAAINSKVTVLDAHDQAFSPLFERIANLRDLNSITDMKPVCIQKGLEAKLVSNIQNLLDDCSAGVLLLPVSNWRKTTAFGDIDLSPIKPGKNSGWRQRLIAIDLNHTWWKDMLELYKESPSVAVCLIVDRLVSDSALLAENGRTIRMKVALRQLEAMG